MINLIDRIRKIFDKIKNINFKNFLKIYLREYFKEKLQE